MKRIWLKFDSITDKLVITNLAMSLAAIAIIGGLSYFAAKQALWSRTFAQLQSVRVVKTRQIETLLNDRIHEAKVICESANFKSLNENFNRESKNFSSRIIEVLNNISLGNVYLQDPVLFFPDDSSYIGNNANPNIKLLRKLKYYYNERSLVDDFFYIDIPGEKPTYYLCGIKRVANKKAIIIFSLSYNTINKIMLENSAESGLGQTGESYLVGPDFLLRSESRFVKNSIFKQSSNTMGVALAINGSEGAEIYKDYRNINVLGSFGKIKAPGINWSLVAEIDLEEANTPIIGIRNIILFLSLLLGIIVFIFTYILAKKITEPIIDLTKTAEKIGKGQIDEKAEISTTDEIGKLARTFNTMIERIKAKEDELSAEKSNRIRLAIDAQEKEREKLSRELHDGLGQLMSGLKLKLEAIDVNNVGEAEEILESVKENLDYTIDEIRRISNGLTPAALQELGLRSAIKTLCAGISAFSGIDIVFNSAQCPENIDKKLQIYVYRIIQEAVNNIIKHSMAASAYITLQETNGKLALSISDDGVGFDVPGALVGTGAGLKNMRERVELVNGEIEYNNIPCGGFLINIKIPNV